VEAKPNLCDIDETRYGSLCKLLRVTAWVLRFVSKLNKRRDLNGPITAQEIENAKSLWEIYVQQRSYAGITHKVKERKKNNLMS